MLGLVGKKLKIIKKIIKLKGSEESSAMVECWSYSIRRVQPTQD